MRIKVGEFDVLESGTVVGNANEPIDFKIEGSPVLTFRLIFVNDIESKEQSAKAMALQSEQGTIQITFTNYNNSLGVGNTSPIPTGHYQGRKLFLNYRIYSLANDGGKHVHYTWLLGEEVGNG